MEQRLKEIIVEVIAEKGAWLIELETMPDHVHLVGEPAVRDSQAGEGH
jgi:putative transposase